MTPKGQRFETVGMLRGIAALLVVYAHLYAQEMAREKENSLIVHFIQQYIIEPLLIIEDFGWFGVCLFFLISGFVITHSIQRENVITFGIRRFLRIYPTLIFCLIITLILRSLQGDSSVNIWSIFQSASLLGVPPNVPSVIGVEWTLYVELKFYLLTILIAPLLRTNVIAAYFIEVIIILIILHFMRYFNGIIFLPSLSGYMISYLLFGQLFYFIYQGKLSARMGFVLIVINYLLCVYGVLQIDPNFDHAKRAQFVTVLYCIVIFYIALHAKNVRVPRILKFYERVSYSLYLLHATIGIAIMHIFLPWVHSFDLRFAMAFVAASLAAWTSYHLVEAPSIATGIRLTAFIAQRKKKADGLH